MVYAVISTWLCLFPHDNLGFQCMPCLSTGNNVRHNPSYSNTHSVHINNNNNNHINPIQLFPIIIAKSGLSSTLNSQLYVSKKRHGEYGKLSDFFFFLPNALHNLSLDHTQELPACIKNQINNQISIPKQLNIYKFYTSYYRSRLSFFSANPFDLYSSDSLLPYVQHSSHVIQVSQIRRTNKRTNRRMKEQANE